VNSSVGVPFKFRRNSKIGEADAETDDEFLFQSFFDTGDIEILRNTRAPARIIVGRTGSGKTALIRCLAKREDHVIEIEPEHLSLNFIANNDVIRFFENIGLKLDLFYGLLWRHVFTVELLKAKYGLLTEEKTHTFFAGLFERFRSKDRAKERAISYLQQWGDKFWIETEWRVKEFTDKLASELKAHAGFDISTLKLGAEANFCLTEEQKREAVHRGQRVVNSIQLKELSDVISILGEEVFSDPQKPYFVVIDRLDENWVEDALRYRLIRALIETIKAFQKVQNVKIVVALRQDLLEKIFSSASDAGFQEEKYQSLILRLKWTPEQLEKMLDQRIATLVRQQYTKGTVRLREILPRQISQTAPIDYLMQRTALRPRDAILFVNNCIERSEGRGEIRVQSIYEAEKDYSNLRLTSLIQEWGALYPSLRTITPLLDHKNAEGRVSSLDKEDLDNIIARLAELPSLGDPAIEAAASYLEHSSSSKNTVIAEVLLVLFRVGAVGFRFEGGGGQVWATQSAAPSASQIKPNTKYLVHPMFHQALHTIF